MRAYDFALAKRIIDTYHNLGILKEAMMGMHEDWYWSSETVYEDGKYLKDGLECYKEGDVLKICNIHESSYCTPVILITLKDELFAYFNCYTGEWDMDILERISHMEYCDKKYGTEVSRMVQQVREQLEITDFKEESV